MYLCTSAEFRWQNLIGWHVDYPRLAHRKLLHPGSRVTLNYKPADRGPLFRTERPLLIRATPTGEQGRQPWGIQQTGWPVSRLTVNDNTLSAPHIGNSPSTGERLRETDYCAGATGSSGVGTWYYAKSPTVLAELARGGPEGMLIRKVVKLQ